MAGKDEIQFPEPIIHRLQSFLTGKEAAQTTIVSKSWHSAYLTRPNLDFDDDYFGVSRYRLDHSKLDAFKKYAKKTFKRYEQSNLKIESFKLCMDIFQYGCAELANKLIVKALRIGATRLCLRLKRGNSFVLTHKVFGADSDNLVGLSVSGGCKIDPNDGVVIKRRRLESLSLDDDVDIKIDTVCNIISSCPSIENLSLLSNIYPRRAAFAMAAGLVDNLIPRLRCLVLGYVSFKTLCLDFLLPRFPFLKDFTLNLDRSGSTNIDTIFEEEIPIFNCSIELLKLVLKGFGYTENKKVRVKFDVPSVRKFTFEGDTIPSLSFMSRPPSREWESHLSIKCNHDDPSVFWFNELSNMLTVVRKSKVHLSLHVGINAVSIDYKVRDKIIQGLRKHDLESLIIDMKHLHYLGYYAFFDGLFRVCHPKLITQYYVEDHDDQRNYPGRSITFLCQTLEEGINFKVSRPTQFMYGLNDLEEVNAQACDMDSVPAVWQPIPFESLLDENVQVHQRVRLLLKWKRS